MPAAEGDLVPNAATNVVVRERIGKTNGETCQEALHQLTWLGVDPFLIHQALEAAMTIVRAIPQDDYA